MSSLLPSSLSGPLLALIVVELALIPVFFLLRARLSPVKEPPELSVSDRRSLWSQILDELAPLEDFLPTWFYPKVDISEIGEMNAVEFLGWAFWHKPLPDRPHPLHSASPMTEEDIAEAKGMLAEALKKNGGRKLAKGYNDQLVCSRLTMDSLKAIPRPWSVYAVTGALNAVHSKYLEHGMGFSTNTWEGKVQYLVRHPSGGPGTTKAEPIVFVHGIGVGLPPYHRFLSLLLQANPDASIVLILLPHVSMKPQSYCPSRADFVEAARGIMAKEKIGKARWIAHSLGTTVFAWIARHAPELVNSGTLIDPVCFSLWDGTVADNFVYKPLTTTALSDRIVRYAVGRELYAAHALSRNFIWHENMLLATHLKALGAPVKAYVAEKDAIADPERCFEWCQKHGVDVVMMPGLGHAGWLFGGDWAHEIVGSVSRKEKQGNGTVKN